jgi:hypothetical protein
MSYTVPFACNALRIVSTWRNNGDVKLKINWTFIAGVLLAAISLTFAATGLSHLFAGAGIAIVVMAVAFEIAKITGTIFIVRNGLSFLSVALACAVLLLSGVSSLGVYGYLGRAYNSGRTSLIATSSRAVALRADVERLQKDEDRLNAQVEAIPARQGTNRRLLALTFQRRLESFSSLIGAKRDSLGAAAAQQGTAANDIGEYQFAADLLHTTQDGIARIVITVLAFLLDPLALLLVMASGVKRAATKPLSVGHPSRTPDHVLNSKVPEAVPVLAKHLRPREHVRR